MATKKTDTETGTKTRATKAKAAAEDTAENMDQLNELPVTEDSEALDSVAADIADAPDENVYDETPLMNEEGEEIKGEPIEVVDYAIEVEPEETDAETGETKRAGSVKVRTRGGRKNKLLGADAYEDLFEVTSEDEAMKKIASEMERHIFRQDILSGNVRGVFRDSRGEVVLRVMMKNGMRVSIPADHFFHPNYISKGQNRVNQRNMNDRYEHLARRMVMGQGAPVRFVPRGVSLFDDGYIVVGDRLEAMNRDRAKYFFNGESHEDALVQRDSLIRMAVFSTGRTYLRAEFGGAEIYVSGTTLSATRFAAADELYAVGSGLDAVVTFMNLDAATNHVELRTTHPDLRNSKKVRARFDSHVEGGTYLATVIKVSPPPEGYSFPIYTIATDENVRGIVYGDKVANREILQTGDRVSFLCSYKNENRMLLFGRCIRCRA